MTKLWLAKVQRDNKVGLIPTDDESRAVIARLGDGECAEFTIVRPRSVQWNRKYWALCREIGRNQDPERDEDSIDTELRILSGHFDVYWVEGREVRVPKRIAFDRLTADEWAAYYAKVEIAVSERFGYEYLAEVA